MGRFPYRPSRKHLAGYEGDMATARFIRELPKQPCRFKVGDKVKVFHSNEVEEVTKTEWDTISESWIVWLGPYAQREWELINVNE
jgi:hypothetical protein